MRSMPGIVGHVLEQQGEVGDLAVPPMAPR
jgi:hypothetical protein